jgi:hypothetical protein
MFATLVAMTSNGSPHSVLRRAILSGDLRSIEMALIDVEHVDLEDALEILVVLARERDPRLAAWSARWAQRIADGERSRTERETAALLSQLPNEEALGSLRAVAVAARSGDLGARGPSLTPGLVR